MSKLKAFVRYDGTNRIVPGGPILQRSKPKNGVWEEIGTNDCCDDFIIADNKKLRAFVRVDGKHNVVAGSLILLEKKPKVGHWVQVATSNCCNAPICLTYTVESATTRGITISALTCDGFPVGGAYRSLTDGIWGPSCLQKDSLIVTSVDPYVITTGTTCTSPCLCYTLSAEPTSPPSTLTFAYTDCNGNRFSEPLLPSPGFTASVCAKQDSVEVSYSGTWSLEGGTVVCTTNEDCI